MNFKTRQKLHKTKRKTIDTLKKVIWVMLYPIIFLSDAYDKLKSNYKKHRVKSLTHEQVANLMCKHIIDILTRRPKYQFEFYVCQTQYCKYGDWDSEPLTVVDYIVDSFDYNKKRKYKLLREWGVDIHYKDKNTVELNRDLTDLIYFKLSEVEGLEVCWKYETHLADKWKVWNPIKDYEKHLVIKVKQ